ncbi:WxL domain-containing protein [Enterococcus sp. AZ192]|uniref:WxL domain-containing protein n=1 Tax=unclassified Enterococcus TaxID=2608891 RepID=UPI003D2A07C5
MKKSIIYSGICAVALTSLIATAQTASAESVKSDGKANFEVPTTIQDPVKPGTDEEIVIDGEKTQVKGVQLLHAPTFDFGTNELKAKGDDLEVIHESYAHKGDEETKYAVPLFVQVGDFSGQRQTNWNVSVSQDAMFKEAAGHTLANSRIRIFNQSFTNNLNNSNASNMVAGVAIPENGHAVIPVASETPDSLNVFSSKKLDTNEGTTNGSISSVVFKKDYDESQYGSGAASAPALDTRYDDVQLNVPASDKAQAKAYSTKLTWSLTVEP